MSDQDKLMQEQPDYVSAPPKASDAMFYGLVGEISRIATQGTEVNRVASAVNAIALLSAAYGPYHYVQIGDVRHPLSYYAIHVGRSMVAGKGEAAALVNRIRDEVNQMMAEIGIETGFDGVAIPFLGQSHSGGISTAEGIARLVHDGIASKDQEEPPIFDKRLLVVEAELARLMEASRRQGNTLSAGLRDLWDGGSIAPAVKQASISATDPHISIRAAITPSELTKYARGQASTNGLLNRFMIFFAERERDVAIPRSTDDTEVRRLAVLVSDAVKFGRGNYPHEKHQVAITMSPEAERIYEKAYPELRGRVGSSENINSLLERRAPMVCRLAALFALTDQMTEISPAHMEAALAWSQYHRDSVEYLFSGDEQAKKKAAKQAEIEWKVITYLADEADWVTRTDITRSAFANHIGKNDLSTALDALLLARKITQVERPRANGIGTHKLYRLRHGSSAPSHHHDLDNATTHHAANEANRANQDQQTDRVSRLSHDSLDPHDSDQPMAASDERQGEEQRVEETLQHLSEQPQPTPPVDDHQVVH